MGVKDVHGGWYQGHDVQIQSGRSGKRCWARVARIYRETQDQHWQGDAETLFEFQPYRGSPLYQQCVA